MVGTDESTVLLATSRFQTSNVHRLAEQCFIVSVTPPTKRDDGNVDNIYRMCRQRNEILARKDPGRPFLSSEVANELAAEIISLFHNLLKSQSAIPWREATFSKLETSLKKLGPILASAPDVLGRSVVDEELATLYQDARLGLTFTK